MQFLFLLPAIELWSYRCLDEVVRLEVHRGRGLVQHQDLGLPQQRAGEADQLPLPHAQVVPGLGNLVVQPRPQRGHKGRQVGLEYITEDVIKNSCLLYCNTVVTWRSAAHTSASSWWWPGSRLCLRLPEKRTGSWGMMVRRERSWCSPSPEMSTPSILIRPGR